MIALAAPAVHFFEQVETPGLHHLFGPGFRHLGVERVQVAHLDLRGGLAGLFVGEPGGVTSARFPMRRIVQEAIGLEAAGWLLAHNHPSGDPMPSRADILLTRRLADMAHALGMTLQDHLIFAGGRVTSLKGLGLL